MQERYQFIGPLETDVKLDVGVLRTETLHGLGEQYGEPVGGTDAEFPRFQSFHILKLLSALLRILQCLTGKRQELPTGLSQRHLLSDAFKELYSEVIFQLPDLLRKRTLYHKALLGCDCIPVRNGCGQEKYNQIYSYSSKFIMMAYPFLSPTAIFQNAP